MINVWNISRATDSFARARIGRIVLQKYVHRMLNYLLVCLVYQQDTASHSVSIRLCEEGFFSFEKD